MPSDIIMLDFQVFQKNVKGKEQSTFSVPADFISFLEEKKTYKRQSVQRSERQWLTQMLAGFWAKDIKWSWLKWTKHDQTQHIAQMGKKKDNRFFFSFFF